MNYPVINYENLKKIKNKKNYNFFVSVGYKNLNTDREKIINIVKNDKFKLISIFHPKVNLPYKIKFGENCLILQYAQFDPNVLIGNNNFFFNGVSISHNTKIGSSNYFASNCTIGGNTTIGNNCFFGINSTILNNLKLSNRVFVGANSFVNKNLKTKSVVIANPDKVLDYNSDKFLKIIDNNY